MAIAFGVDSHAMNVLSRLRDDKHRTPNATEVPVVSTALGKVHLRHAALLQHFHFEAILLVAKEHAVRDIHRMTGEPSLIGAVACLTTIDLHTNLRKGCLKNQQYLATCPLFGQCKLMLIQSFLVGNAFRSCLAVEAHTVLVGAEALQFPAGGYSYLCPLAAIATVGTLEVPLHHIVTTVTTQILSLCFHQWLSLCCRDGQPQQGQ